MQLQYHITNHPDKIPGNRSAVSQSFIQFRPTGTCEEEVGQVTVETSDAAESLISNLQGGEEG